ncbi:MAG: hypothetical protein JNL41_19480 [Phenylobacterium sp.]|uniref:class I SAM-dependent methyltransferase n=1 Tax=Phenylobacterium sp. TaxID=1871053 RepID=UPI001A44E074|nr:hypothetical protein [Phenylobacterium sp.]MBL8556465.1 hypothetical protein [Phenylobacterium sp.]
MKLNLGCGHNHKDGFVNVDSAAASAPDVVWDLEQTPWPWPDNSAEEVEFIHSLEHIGGDPKLFLAVMTELYRVCAPGAAVRIHVPHPRHDNFLNDPTHVRPVTPEMLGLFDRALNDQWKAKGAANSPLAHYTGVDFVTESCGTVLDEPYAGEMQAGRITPAQLGELIRSRNNVAREYRIVLRARKPA